jgi:hypothetical protein
MRFLLLLFALILSNVLRAQSPLFLIVNFTEGVTLDGRVPKIGEMVYQGSKELHIPETGYALVITHKGDSYVFTKSISVNKVVKKVTRALKPLIAPVGSVTRVMNMLEVIGAPSAQFAGVIGDTVLIAVKAHFDNVPPPYVIEFKDMEDEILLSDTLRTNWKIQSISFSDLKILLFEVNKDNLQSGRYLIRKLESTKREKLISDIFQTARVGNSEILKLPMFQMHNLYYDQIFLLYKLTVLDYRPENDILEAYIEKLREKFDFKRFNFHK